MEELIKYIKEGIAFTYKKQTIGDAVGNEKVQLGYHIERSTLEDVLDRALEIQKLQQCQN